MGRAKNRHTLWLYDDTWGLVGSHYKDHNCTTQNEFIEQAIRFYCGYLDADRDGTYLPDTLSAVLEGALSALGDRLGKLLFKLAVEESMLMHIISHDTDITPDELEHLRGRCVKDVMRTRGMIGFKDILRFQKEL